MKTGILKTYHCGSFGLTTAIGGTILAQQSHSDAGTDAVHRLNSTKTGAMGATAGLTGLVGEGQL